MGMVSGVLGGLCWLARWVIDLAELTSDPREALYWAGAGLLALAFLGYGMGLVKKGALWLRLIVGVAFPVLVWSVLEVLRTADPEPVDGVFGAVVAVVSAVLFVRRPRPEPVRRPGAHAR
jgi:hypothetical protein